mmetsp:Transcript_43676/g.123653  ORF Transcript_43676/g.123653 Transcript_43676/m.123653 type:complete len:209 (+) Transcript_43676:572-1198(+)
MSAVFCLESSLIRSKMKSVCARKISLHVADRQTTLTECRAAFLTCNSSSLRHASRASFRGKTVMAGHCFAAAKRIAETADARTRQHSLALFESRDIRALRTVSWSTISRCPRDSETTFRTLSSCESAYWLRMGRTRGTCGRRWSARDPVPGDARGPAPGDLCATPMAMTSRRDVSKRYWVFCPFAAELACWTLSMTTFRRVPIAPTVA